MGQDQLNVHVADKAVLEYLRNKKWTNCQPIDDCPVNSPSARSPKATETIKAS